MSAVWQFKIIKGISVMGFGSEAKMFKLLFENGEVPCTFVPDEMMNHYYLQVKVQKSAVATTKIKEVPKQLTLKKGKAYSFTPVLTPITSEQKVTYKSSNRKIVTVSSSGKVTAKKKGKATITIKSGKVTVKCKVTVK